MNFKLCNETELKYIHTLLNHLKINIIMNENYCKTSVKLSYLLISD